MILALMLTEALHGASGGSYEMGRITSGGRESAGSALPVVAGNLQAGSGEGQAGRRGTGWVLLPQTASVEVLKG
jgi:hypothetical protein